MASYRVLITGSRTWGDAAIIHAELENLLAGHGGVLTVVHGNARKGADKVAHDWALSQHYASSCGTVTPEPHPADWDQYGKRAGYVRNEAMVTLGADLCLAFIMPCTLVRCTRRKPHGSHGAEHCASLAEKAGIEVRRFDG